MNKLNEIDINKIKNLESIEKNIELRIEWAKERFQDSKFIKERENLRKASLEIKKIIKSKNRYLNFGDLQDKNIINTNKGLKIIDPMPGYGPKHFDLAFWTAMINKEGSIGDIIEEICKI